MTAIQAKGVCKAVVNNGEEGEVLRLLGHRGVDFASTKWKVYIPGTENIAQVSIIHYILHSDEDEEKDELFEALCDLKVPLDEPDYVR